MGEIEKGQKAEAGKVVSDQFSVISRQSLLCKIKSRWHALVFFVKGC